MDTERLWQYIAGMDSRSGQLDPRATSTAEPVAIFEHSDRGAEAAMAAHRHVAVEAHRQPWHHNATTDSAGQQGDDVRELLLHERLHVPARSGRYREQVENQGRGGAARINKGIGRGYAKGTELAQEDSRANTWVCGGAGCSALVDVHWARRRAKAARPEHAAFAPADGCAHCAPAFKRAQYVKGQRKMARQLASGERRLVRRHGQRADRDMWEQPTAALAAAVAAALAQADRAAAARYQRGRRS